ncbi:MAG: hypothetical protein ACRDPO_05735, partial [Streptosporangiaceae bacterium]
MSGSVTGRRMGRRRTSRGYRAGRRWMPRELTTTSGPQFELMWSWHQERWPERPKADDEARPGDPPGSWRGDGERFLRPERNAEADRQIAATHS